MSLFMWRRTLVGATATAHSLVTDIFFRRSLGG